MRHKRIFYPLLSCLCVGIAVPAVGADTPLSAVAPLSAIDWLSQSVATPAALNKTVANQPATLGEAPVTSGGALPQPVTISVLGKPRLDAVGLLASAVTGLPPAVWGNGDLAVILPALAAAQVDGIPALQDLLITLLLAESEPPSGTATLPDGALLMARIDKLLQIGALDQALALVQVAGPAANADLFRRAFDVSLLTGAEDRACAALKSAPGLVPAPPARIFCAARAGDWENASLTLRTERSLGALTETDADVLGRFLDPDSAGDAEMPPAPKPLTPLMWRIYDALGASIPTATLPLAFSHAELSPRAGWKAQIEAAERLARAGVLSPNLLLGVYTDREPAASGGVWDRVDAFGRFDAAMASGDGARIAAALPIAYDAMKTVELEVPFAALYAEALAKVELDAAAADTAFELGLLSPKYETLSAQYNAGQHSAGQRQDFLAGLARGDIAGRIPPDSMGRAIAPAFAPQGSAPELPTDLAELAQSGKVGQAVLAAIARINAGVLGDDLAITEGLGLLRALGLESAARRSALELMILERRG